MVNYTLPDNITGMGSVFSWANEITTIGGTQILGPGILLVVWLIAFSVGRIATDTSRGLVLASFITGLISVIFFAIGLIGGYVLGICIIVFGLGIVAARISA